MTGIEYLNLSEGDKLILTEEMEFGTADSKWSKGNIIEVLYRNRFEESLYLKNCNLKDSNEHAYKRLDAYWLLRSFKLYKKFNQAPVTKTTFKHKFNVGDTVWQMDYNEPTPRKIVRLQYIDEDGEQYFSYICDDDLALDDNCKIYATKDELLDSLR